MANDFELVGLPMGIFILILVVGLVMLLVFLILLKYVLNKRLLRMHSLLGRATYQDLQASAAQEAEAEKPPAYEDLTPPPNVFAIGPPSYFEASKDNRAFVDSATSLDALGLTENRSMQEPLCKNSVTKNYLSLSL